MSFGITTYPDVPDVYRRLRHLLELPPLPLRAEAMEGYLRSLEERCPRSRAIIGEAKELIPGGVQHNLSFNFPFPLVIDRAEGPYLWDVDGNRYLDFLQAGGPTILGSNHPAVREPVLELIRRCSPATGLFHEYELEIAREIHRHVASVEMFRMLGSGTEAVMAAIRLARLATGKRWIVKAGGAYHGWSDQVVYSLKIPGTRRFEAHGIPRGSSAATAESAPNDPASLERVLLRNRFLGGTAAVLVEPFGPESGTRPVDRGYNAEVRRLCDRYGALMIFDEVVTGFRTAVGGAQAYFGITPDLTVFGKVIAGGYPGAGGVGGRKDLMRHLAAGVESGKKRAYVGGTLAAAMVSAAAGYHAIREIARSNACELAGRAGDRVTHGLQALVDKYRLPFVVYNQGSIVHLETVGGMFVPLSYLRILRTLREIKVRKELMERYGAAYAAEGLVTIAGSRLYTSAADTDEVIDDALGRFERVFAAVDRTALGGAA
jgi:glutamate-1-semialdehyde 2,1-aminomutase